MSPSWRRGWRVRLTQALGPMLLIRRAAFLCFVGAATAAIATGVALAFRSCDPKLGCAVGASMATIITIGVAAVFSGPLALAGAEIFRFSPKSRADYWMAAAVGLAIAIWLSAEAWSL